MNIRQSTARTVIVGPILDSTGAAKTDEVVASILASKNGSDPAALNGSATLTHKAAGYYRLALTTSDSDTLGCLELILSSTTNTMPVKGLNVLTAAAWDALHATSGGSLPGDLQTIKTQAVTCAAGVTVGPYVGGASAAAGTALDAAGVRAAVGLASANIDTQIGTLATASNLATVAGYLDAGIAAILGYVDCLPASWVVPGTLTAQQVWEYATRTLTSAGSGGATAQEVWEYATRTLTSLGNGSGLTAVPWNAAWDAEVQSECADALTAATIATASDIAAVASSLDLTIGPAVAIIESVVTDATYGNNALLAAINAWDGGLTSGQQAELTAAAKVGPLIADDAFTEEALANAPTGGGSGGTVGPGAIACTITVNDTNGDPLDGVEVWISTDSAGQNVIAGTLHTDASGQVEFMLDAGSYYVWRQKSGYDFTNPQQITVSE